MGTKVVLAPRNSAEAVALGVSACFLAVAGVVVHGNSAAERAAISTQNLAAQVQDVRTVSRPSAKSEELHSRLPSVLVPEPPLVLLPLQDQAKAKIAAAGTPRGDGVVLVAWSRGAGTLSPGGGLTGVAPVPAAPLTANRPNGAVGFPSTTAPGVVTAAPATSSPSAPSGTPSAAPSAPTGTTPPASETTPPPPVETSQPPVDPTPTTPVETTPGGNGGSDGGGSTGGTGGGSTGGGSTDSGTGGTGSGTDGTDTTSDQAQQDPAGAVVTVPTETAVTPGPTPESRQD